MASVGQADGRQIMLSKNASRIGARTARRSFFMTASVV